MDEARKKRLDIKYGGLSGDPAKKPLMTNHPGRGTAMAAKGKPKDLKKTVARLLRYLSGQRFTLYIAVFFAVLNTLSTLAASYALRPIINRFIYFDPDQTTVPARLGALFGGLAFMAVIYAVSILSQWLQQRLMLNVSQKTLFKMRNELYGKLQRLPV
ncbi:MAG: ABC transporter ATP-binding protein, partial [Clostridia bacterium]|nr:ABC transporter ATP-binding protein [Clostridia bacterium]